MNMKSTHLAILITVIILGGVLILQLSGLWITEGKKVPTKISTGDAVGMANPSDIRGSYTFEDINTYFNISPIIIAKAFVLDTSIKEAALYKAKDIEVIYSQKKDLKGDIGTDSLKFFVSLYLGIPFTAEEDTYLPSTAIDVLLQKGKITEDTYKVLSEKSYTTQALPTPSNQNASSPLPTQEAIIKGNTTFQDLLNWGLTVGEIESVLKSPMNSKTETIRDVATKQGVEFSYYKNSFQDLLNKK